MRTTTSQGTGVGIRYPSSGSLDIESTRLSAWIKDSNLFYVYVRVHATNGSDYYIRYQPTTGSPYAISNYAIIPVGTEYRDGTWRLLDRDLSADLQSVFGVGVETVKWFCIRGNYDMDDLMLLDDGGMTKYYLFAGQRVAMDRDGVVQYLLSDHLHSTSLVLNDDGSVDSQARYREASRSEAEWATLRRRALEQWNLINRLQIHWSAEN